MLTLDRMDAELAPIQFEAAADLDAAPEVAFALISDHRRLPSWIPGLRRVEVDESQALSPGGVGTRRTLYPVVGPFGVEVVVEFEPPRRMAYSASDASLRGLLTRHRAELWCEPSAAGTRVRWVVRGVPARTWWKRMLAWLFVRHAQRAGLANLRRHFAAQRAISV